MQNFFKLIKNAQESNKRFFKVLITKKNVVLAEIVFKNNFALFFRFVGKFILVFFYQNIFLKQNQISFAKNLGSKSLRFNSFWQIQGLKTSLITTSRGLITSFEAKKQKEGGFLFCFFI